jgi:leucyl aminopeptidase (aminopeptidase T)
MPTHNELYKEPFKLVFKDSYLVDYSGDPVQVERLRVLMDEVDPKPDLCDEIGLVTTTSPENNMYGWKVDGTHQNNCIHVAIGNNRRRGEVIHSTEHIDFDVHEPTIYMDGICIMKDGKFDDEVINANA